MAQLSTPVEERVVEKANPTGPAKSKHGWLSRLRSYFVFNPLIWLYTFVLGIVSIPAGFFDRGGRLLHGFARVWSVLIMKTICSPVSVEGLESINTHKTCVYAVNHASALDIPMLYVYLPFQFRIAFKKELLSYPIVGWHLKRSGQICIDQQNSAASIGSIRAALKSLKSGLPLVIFPEGGRTLDGEIKPFMAGAFFLAIKAQVDIVPVALIGTFDLLPMNTYHIKSQPLKVKFGAPISTASLSLRDTEALSEKVRNSMLQLFHSTSSLQTD